jgi:hypothetical protein
MFELYSFLFAFFAVGWEFHAYLIRKSMTSNTIYEPTEKETRPLEPGVFGIKSFKEAYFVLIQPKK